MKKFDLFKEKKEFIHNYNVMYIMREEYGEYDHRSLDIQEQQAISTSKIIYQ